MVMLSKLKQSAHSDHGRTVALGLKAFCQSAHDILPNCFAFSLAGGLMPCRPRQTEPALNGTNLSLGGRAGLADSLLASLHTVWQQHAHSPRLALALLRTADMLLAETEIERRNEACLGAHWLPGSAQQPLQQIGWHLHQPLLAQHVLGQIAAAAPIEAAGVCIRDLDTLVNTPVTARLHADILQCHAYWPWAANHARMLRHAGCMVSTLAIQGVPCRQPDY